MLEQVSPIKTGGVPAQFGYFFLPYPKQQADVDFCRAVMAQTVILTAVYEPVGNVLKYLAYSHMFKALKSGEKIPWYKFTVSYSGDKTRVIVDMLPGEFESRNNAI